MSHRHAIEKNLPIRSLTGDEFEQLCEWLLGAEGFTEISRLGGGSAQHGVDLFATKNGQRHVVQCKQVVMFPPSRAKKEVEKLQGLQPDEVPDVYVLAATADLSLDTQRVVKAGVGPGTSCEFWGPSTLDRSIRRHPHILDRFFSGPVQGDQLDRRHNILPPARDFTGRETELEELLAAVDAKPGAMIAGLQGMGGIGKTELARRIAEERWDAYPDAHLEVDLLGASASPFSSAAALSASSRRLGPRDAHQPLSWRLRPSAREGRRSRGRRCTHAGGELRPVR